MYMLYNVQDTCVKIPFSVIVFELIKGFVDYVFVFLGTIKPAESAIDVAAKRLLFREIVASYHVVTV